MTLLEQLEEWDRSLFLAINGLNSPFFDSIMLAASNAIWWLPLFIWLIFELFKAYPGKKFFWIALAIIISITLTDRLSVMAFKEVFLRFRPCHDPEIQNLVHLVKSSCGGKYGFVSSHAANYAGLATLVTLLLRFQYKRIYMLMILWAGLIGYSRIYLGVHYPGDVVGGWILGTVIGFLVFKLIQKPIGQMS